MEDKVVHDQSSRTSRDRPSTTAASPGRAVVYVDAFIFFTALLLSAVFQYLIGSLDKGGTKVHSSGSLEFRSMYVSIVLLLGAYVWIKFRDVAPPSQQKPSAGLHRKCKLNDLGMKVYHGNYEPRFKPPGSDNYISVGSYEVEEDAKIIYHILAFYYGKDVPGELPLLNGLTYLIPCMTEEEQHLDPETKKKWARSKAKPIFEEYNGALVESLVSDCLGNSEIEATEDIFTTIPPPECPAAYGMDSSRIEAEAQPSQLGIQSDDLELVSPSSFNPNVDTVPPGMQGHVADITFSDHVVGDANRAEVPDEQPLEPQFQHQSLQEKEADNVIPDYSSILRQVKELERQQQLQQLQIQQQDTRFELHKQLHQLEIQQLQSRISELEGEIERLRSTEHARKRICTGLYLRNDSQN